MVTYIYILKQNKVKRSVEVEKGKGEEEERRCVEMCVCVSTGGRDGKAKEWEMR